MSVSTRPGLNAKTPIPACLAFSLARAAVKLAIQALLEA